MKTCFQCGRENEEQAFCGSCGAALDLRTFVNASVREQLEVRDRTRLESDAALRVFERVFNWVKIVGIVWGVVIAAVAALGLWKASDWWSSVNAAKQSLVADSTKAAKAIEESAASATKTISASAAHASQQSDSFATFAAKAKGDLSAQSGKLKQEVDGTRQQLADAGKLQPQMTDMQNQLKGAVDRIRDQQKTISSSEEFVKQVFSSHKTDSFVLGQQGMARIATRQAPASGNRAIVVLLLSNTPISQTLQLQYRVFAQPSGSFFNIHNMVVFFWGEPLENLNNQQLSASYFPDKTDPVVIKALSEDKSRIYADGVPLPYLNELDPDFKDNQFFKRAPNGFTTIP